MCSGSQAASGSSGCPSISSSRSLRAPAPYSTRPSNGAGATRARRLRGMSESMSNRYPKPKVHRPMTDMVLRQDDEAKALVRLGFDELNGFTGSIATTERDIAARAFRHVPAGTPIQFVHDTISRGVVGALAGGTTAVGRGAEALVGLRPRADRPLSANVVGGLGLSVLTGLIGDRLERERSPLQEPMSVRVDGLP